MATATFDDLLRDLNSFGPYQCYTIALLTILPSFVPAWSIYDLVFILYNPEKSCQLWNSGIVTTSQIQRFLGNVSDECEYEGQQLWDGHSRSKITLRCDKWTWDQRAFDQTVMTQWGLCQDPALSKSAMAIFAALGLVGLVIMSLIQDWLGRKPAFFICLTFILAGNGLSMMAPSFVAWVAIRALQGTQMFCIYSLSFVWAQEFVDAPKRTWVNFLVSLLFSLAHVSLALIAWACHNWIKLDIALVSPFVFLYSYYWLVDESPRWLLSVGKAQEAKAILKKIATWNKKEAHLPKILDQVDLMVKPTTRALATFRPLELIKHPNLRSKVILLTVVTTASAITYTSIAFNTRNLGNIFVAYIVQASMEAPAAIFILLMGNRIGRISSMIISLFWASLFCFLCIPAYVQKWNGWYVIIFASVAKFGASISYNVMYQAAAELYPTTLRATGVGMSMFLGDLSFGVLPYILDSAKTHEWIPMLILGSISFIGASCCCCLPESKDRPMPQTPEEAEAASKVGLHQLRVHIRNVFRRSDDVPLLSRDTGSYGSLAS